MQFKNFFAPVQQQKKMLTAIITFDPNNFSRDLQIVMRD